MPEISYLSHYFSTLGCQVEHTLSPFLHNEHTSTCQVGMNLGLNANPKISLSEIEAEKRKSKKILGMKVHYGMVVATTQPTSNWREGPIFVGCLPKGQLPLKFCAPSKTQVNS